MRAMKKSTSIVSMTLAEIKKLPKSTPEEIASLKAFEDKDISDCPSPKNLEDFRLAREMHPEWYKVRKVDVHLKIDADVLAILKAEGKGYQTRINEILRQAVFGVKKAKG